MHPDVIRLFDLSGKAALVTAGAVHPGLDAASPLAAAGCDRRGVCVNAVSPGGFERGQPAQFIRDYGDRTPLGPMGRNGIDLNGAVLFPEHNLAVDGGFTIWH